jgi:hypothetical protein
MTADHLIPSCESASLNVPPYLVAQQDLLSQFWRNIYGGVYSSNQKLLVVLIVWWQEQEQALSAQFQWRLNLGLAIAWLSTLDLSDAHVSGVGSNGGVV